MFWKDMLITGVLLLANLNVIWSATVPAAAPPVDRRVASAAFAQAGKKEGVEIWRIEKFAPVPVDRSNYGKFHEGDSYVILHTKVSRGQKSYDIHYWLGKETSQDESASAAIIATHLDQNLGGAPVQHREVQGEESQMFRSYFPLGIKYLPGGVGGGLHHVTPNAPSTKISLYEVKGKRNIHVRLIEPKASAMNKGDSYVLDAGNTIYAYYGSNSHKKERLKAISAANQIRDKDHSGRAKVEIIDENSTPEEVESFFKALGGGTRKSLIDATKVTNDEHFERDADKSITLYKVSDASGSLKMEKVPSKPLSKDALNTNDAFILDTTTVVYVWNGRKASKAEKDDAKKRAAELIKTKNYPSWVQVVPVIEGGEPTTFKQYFDGWRESLDMAGLGRG